MPAPTVTITRSPTTATLTEAAPSAAITLDDTSTYVTFISRQMKEATVAIAGATGDPQVVRAIRGGTLSFTCTGTDSGGTATSGAVTVTVTDDVAASTTALLSANGGNRIPPGLLPKEWRDPTVATPGLPSAAADIFCARTYGTTLPTALANAIV